MRPSRSISQLMVSIGLLAMMARPCYAAWEVKGFIESLGGLKLRSDATKHEDFNAAEARVQLETVYYFEKDDWLSRMQTLFTAKGDFVIDGYYGGATDESLRELNISTTPLDWMDVKIGRQILTWGVGDFIFINDQFPKDYESFFIGREDEYLKKPSDAVRLSLYPGMVDVDAVIMRFTPNTQAKGERLSFYDPFTGALSGRGTMIQRKRLPQQPEHLEYAVRMHKTIASMEAAVYAFRGYQKNPDSFYDGINPILFHRRLDVYGFSLRGPGLGGIVSSEFGYEHSTQDSEGDNRLILNSRIKFLVGYNRDLGNDLTIGLQHLWERQLDRQAYLEARLPQDLLLDERRSLWTLRLTKKLWRQTFTLSAFVFYSPTDKDGYLRPHATYEVNDRVTVTLGMNWPWGEDDFTEFGQMRRNRNVYVRCRWSF